MALYENLLEKDGQNTGRKSAIYCGDALDVLRTLPAGIVQTCVSSPPYYGLRDYGVSGQIGIEPTPEEFVARLVNVFSEVKRVMCDSGTLWLNIGDSYAGNGKGSNADGSIHPPPSSEKQSRNKGSFIGTHKPQKARDIGLKPKDLIGIPWMLAFALRADGWYLRSDIIWNKINSMPESVKDRPTKSHEYIFLLSKSANYYYDHEAIKEDYVNNDTSPGGFIRGRIYNYNSKEKTVKRQNNQTHQLHLASINDYKQLEGVDRKRNKRDVWTLASHPFSGAHYATFPRNLILPCILAGSRPGDIVLDPFGGSGTTAKTAQEFGRNHITIELNQQYVDDIIKPRLNASNVQISGL